MRVDFIVQFVVFIWTFVVLDNSPVWGDERAVEFCWKSHKKINETLQWLELVCFFIWLLVCFFVLFELFAGAVAKRVGSFVWCYVWKLQSNVCFCVWLNAILYWCWPEVRCVFVGWASRTAAPAVSSCLVFVFGWMWYCDCVDLRFAVCLLAGQAELQPQLFLHGLFLCLVECDTVIVLTWGLLCVCWLGKQNCSPSCFFMACFCVWLNVILRLFWLEVCCVFVGWASRTAAPAFFPWLHSYVYVGGL